LPAILPYCYQFAYLCDNLISCRRNPRPQDLSSLRNSPADTVLSSSLTAIGVVINKVIVGLIHRQRGCFLLILALELRVELPRRLAAETLLQQSWVSSFQVGLALESGWSANLLTVTGRFGFLYWLSCCKDIEVVG
jgi:hypothetical protein